MGGGASWEDIAGFYGKPELMDERFRERRQREEHGEEFDTILVDAIKDRGKWEMFQTASDMRMLFGLVQTPEELLECPQLESRGFYRDVEHPIMGGSRCPRCSSTTA